MIVRDEAHVVREVLNAVAPFISSWVIVDTGSEDGTQDVVRAHMAGLGIPGELYERPWKNFGHNRSEALALAQGRGDYIWVIDADDMVFGTPDFDGLTAGVYALSYGTHFRYWRPQLFRDGLPWRYVGVVHEYATCDEPYVEDRLHGEYHLESRRLGSRNLDPKKYERDRDLLLAEVERDPSDVRSMFYLAQSCFDLGDYNTARYWYARRAEETSGFVEEIYFSLFRLAETLAHLGAPWQEVQDAYLRAWECRPTRAEPLFAIAHHYRTEERYHLGYLFAEQAARIPLPELDVLFIHAEVYAWSALDELAVCASWIGRNDQALAIFEWLLTKDCLPDEDRNRISANRDFCADRLAELDAAQQLQTTGN
ncbi:glycosyltransferase family 2 protein [Mycolicibacterium helvum]